MSLINKELIRNPTFAPFSTENGHLKRTDALLALAAHDERPRVGRPAPAVHTVARHDAAGGGCGVRGGEGDRAAEAGAACAAAIDAGWAAGDGARTAAG